MMGERLLLGIESSCDETAAAVVTDRLHVRSNVVRVGPMLGLQRFRRARP